MDMIQGLLPIGSVVLLKGGTKRVMIVGLCQKSAQTGELKDYSAVLYPEGFVSAGETYLFNNDQIDRLYAIGYQDEECFAFKQKLNQALADYREKKNSDE